MKKSVLLINIIVFVLIAIMSAVGVYAVVATMININSKMVFDVTPTDMEMQIRVKALWAPNTPEFESRSTYSGLSKDCWEMPNLNFVSSSLESAKLIITIKNENNENSVEEKRIPFKITISGLQYDTQRDIGEYRFLTHVSHKIDEGDSTPEIAINSEHPNYFIDELPAGSSVQIVINYNLIWRNTNIGPYNQNITVQIEGVQ